MEITGEERYEHKRVRERIKERSVKDKDKVLEHLQRQQPKLTAAKLNCHSYFTHKHSHTYLYLYLAVSC